MAERESFRFDRHALQLGARRGILAAVLCFGALRGVSYATGPALRDLPGNLSAPGWGPVAVVAALVGCALGWVRLRSARRIVAVGFSGADAPGSRALAIARHSGAGLSHGLLAGALPVQRWSPDLLGVGAAVPDSESVS